MGRRNGRPGKMVVLSYDDGVEQDRKLVEIVNRYGVKVTFNLNSGLQSEKSTWTREGMTVRRMNSAGLVELYAGHEIASHSCTHQHLERLQDEQLREELGGDKRALEKFFGTEVTGLAWPYGASSPAAIRVARECGLRYGRGVKSTHCFDVPRAESVMMFQPTCHHDDPELFTMAETFLNLPDRPALLCVWGHSYEFDINDNWNRFEEFCKLVSGCDDVAYLTTREALL